MKQGPSIVAALMIIAKQYQGDVYDSNGPDLLLKVLLHGIIYCLDLFNRISHNPVIKKSGYQKHVYLLNDPNVRRLHLPVGRAQDFS